MAYLNHLHQQPQYHHHAANPFPQHHRGQYNNNNNNNGHHHPQQQHHHHHQQQHYNSHPHHPQQQHHHPHHPAQQQQRYPYGGGMGGMMDTEEDRMEAAAAEELLDSDSLHELVLPLDFLPCPNTVIVGRGKKVAQHAGNVRFRELVKKELTEYSAATTKAHKSSIIVRVLTEIRNKSHFAFVKQNLTTGRWYRVEETAQRITTAQAFRDALKDNYKSSRAFKKLKREEEKTKNGKGEGVDEKTKEKKEKKKLPKKTKSKSSTATEAAAPVEPTRQESMEDAEEPEPEPESAPPAAEEEALPTPPEASSPAEDEEAAPKKKKPAPKSLEDLRSILEQSQTALVSGNFSWWDPNAVTAMDEDKQHDKKMPPPAAIPSTSVSSCSSLLWSNHSTKWSNHSRRADKNNNNKYDWGLDAPAKPRSRAHDMSNHSSINKWGSSNHSIRTMSNHSIMTISGHSTRSNSTFNGLVSKYAPSSNADMQGNPFEPTPIPAAITEDGGAMDMDMDDNNNDCQVMEAHCPPPKTYAPLRNNFDDAMGLGNLSDHSLMSNISTSMHSVKGIFADSNHNKGFSPEEIFGNSNHMMMNGTSVTTTRDGQQQRRGIFAGSNHGREPRTGSSNHQSTSSRRYYNARYVPMAG